jgi:hypothetical protein
MLVLAVALTASACTESGAGEDQTTSTATSVLETLQPPTTTTATSTFTPTTSAAEPTTPAIPDDLFRLAPRSTESTGFLRYFDQSGSYFTGHTLGFSKELDGPLVEVADLSEGGGLVFQRSWEDSVIWSMADGPEELLVGADNQRLQLEGGGEVGGELLVYYQRHTRASPEETESSLRSFNPLTGEVTVIAVTGGWEWNTSFSYLTGRPGVAITDEGVPGMYLVDLEADRGGYIQDFPPICPELGAPYEHATFVGEQILGDRAVFNTHDGVVDEWGFYVLDPDTCEENLVESFPWDNGEWYIESLIGPIVNLRTKPDSTGKALPALRLDLSGQGGSWTALEAGFLRPAFLS